MYTYFDRPDLDLGADGGGDGGEQLLVLPDATRVLGSKRGARGEEWERGNRKRVGGVGGTSVAAGLTSFCI